MFMPQLPSCLAEKQPAPALIYLSFQFSQVLFTFRHDASSFLLKTDRRWTCELRAQTRSCHELFYCCRRCLVGNNVSNLVSGWSYLFYVAGESSSMESLSLALSPDGERFDRGCCLRNCHCKELFLRLLGDTTHAGITFVALKKSLGPTHTRQLLLSSVLMSLLDNKMRRNWFPCPAWQLKLSCAI